MTKLATRLAIILMAATLPLTAEAQGLRGHGGGGGVHTAPGRGAAPVMRAGPRPSFHAPARFHAPVAHFRPRVSIHRRAYSGAFRHQSRAVRSLRATRSVRRAQIRRAAVRRAHLRNDAIRRARLHRSKIVRRAALAPRRSGLARTTALRARQGRFATLFADRQRARWHDGRRWWWARRAWRYGALAAFVPWYGPLFWPYAYADLFDYAFWPYGYYDCYWAYAYDDFFDGIFWGESYPPVAYAYAAPSTRAPTARYATVEQLCRQPGSGVTAWPIAEIERKVGLNGEQRQLLADVRAAGVKAADIFKNSCPEENAFPLTPPGRLRAMTARLQAVLEAVTTVRPALDKFYASLSDEQKERFNEIGPRRPKGAPEAAQASAEEAQSCKQPKPGLANLPIKRIEDVVKPTDAQMAGLQKLQDATNQAVSILQAACPDETPLTPPGRMETMEKRLKAMIEAANTVEPALDNFYAGLNDEQKARFNRIGLELAQAGDNK